MPNCDFYATPADHSELLSWLFSERSCEVYELASEVETPLKRFESAEEVTDEFKRSYGNGKPRTDVYLQIYVLGAGPPFVPQRTILDPAKCDGATYRFGAEGWGLVQLYLSAPSDGRLSCSHTNHNTRKRAETWERSGGSLGPVAAWDFDRITSFSSRFNRYVKRSALAAIGSRAVLPHALEASMSGLKLDPYDAKDLRLI